MLLPGSSQEPFVQEVLGSQVAQAAQHGASYVLKTRVELIEQVFEESPVPVGFELGQVRAALYLRGSPLVHGLPDQRFVDVAEGTDKAFGSAVGRDVRPHGFESLSAEKREQEADADIIEVVSECDGVAAEFFGGGMELSSPES